MKKTYNKFPGLKSNRLAVYSTMAVAALSVPENAQSQVTYVDIDPDVFVSEGTGNHDIDLDGNGDGDVLFWHATNESWGPDFLCAGGLVIHSYSAGIPLEDSPGHYARVLYFGELAGFGDWTNATATLAYVNTYGSGPVALSPWVGGGDKFLIIDFDNDEEFGDYLNHMWLRLSVDTCGYTLKDYAFSDLSLTIFYAGMGMPCIAPEPAGTFSITHISAKVKWDPLVNADKYQLFYRQIGTMAWTKKKNIVDSQKKIQGLSCGITYEWKVRSECDGDLSPFSSIQTFTTNACRLGSSDQITELEIVSIYPNPASDKLFVELGNYDENINMEIFDVVGNKIVDFSSSIEDEIISIDISPLPAGVYILNISTTELTKTIQFVHQ